MKMSSRSQPIPIVRRWTKDDISGVVACHRAAYPEYGADNSHYDEEIYAKQLQAFPDGQFLVEMRGTVAAYATSLILRLRTDGQPGTYDELTSEGSFCRHSPDGDTLYGADIAVHPDFRGLGLSRLLYGARRRLLQRFNLRRMVAYGRIPGYRKYADRLSAKEYVHRVLRGDVRDPALSTHLRAGYSVKQILRNPAEEDPVLEVCTLLEMPNPDFIPHLTVPTVTE